MVRQSETKERNPIQKNRKLIQKQKQRKIRSFQLSQKEEVVEKTVDRTAHTLLTFTVAATCEGYLYIIGFISLPDRTKKQKGVYSFTYQLSFLVGFSSVV
mmetsp:Transcript_9577/g.11590  ORF Transcript_9577/g.11590 Transcript_9577/m.11590 type:complete len:100 (+) Transcript_9577:956-1255(+)